MPNTLYKWNECTKSKKDSLECSISFAIITLKKFRANS